MRKRRGGNHRRGQYRRATEEAFETVRALVLVPMDIRENLYYHEKKPMEEGRNLWCTGDFFLVGNEKGGYFSGLEGGEEGELWVSTVRTEAPWPNPARDRQELRENETTNDIH